MNDQIPVLDHGYVQLVEHWGSDQAIIESARMSTQKGFLGWGVHCDAPGCELRGEALKQELSGEPCPQCGATLKPGDEKLLRFMYEHNHSTPFEFAGMIVEVQAPLFVFREWHRHRTQSYSEASARYAPLPDFNYVPTAERCLRAGGANKQAGAVKGALELTDQRAEEWLRNLAELYEDCERFYQYGLKVGIPKELARLAMPVGRYSRMRASANLRNWFGFLTLRTAPNAQWEIQEYARAVEAIIRSLYPRTWELFAEARAE